MQHKKIRQGSVTVGTVMALGLQIADVQAEQAAFKAEEIPAHSGHDHKMMEGGCGGHMRMDVDGMVMYENKDELPKECEEISEDVNIEVRAGVKYSKDYPGTVFGFDQHQWTAKPCSRITVNFINDDDIRHQWMIHGLPRYMYPEGMFHLEVNGKKSISGTFIVPSSHYTYLVHCDIAQHMEKGMKAQLVVGEGRGNLPSIPGISAPAFRGQQVQ